MTFGGAAQRALDRATATFDPRLLLSLSRFVDPQHAPSTAALARVLAARVVGAGRRDAIALFAAHASEETGIFAAIVDAFIAREHVMQNVDVQRAWTRLVEHACDVRRPVRSGVEEALVDLVSHGLDAHIALFFEGDLPASVALSALARREVLAQRARFRIGELIVQALDRVEFAPRSAARSQGRRTLINTLATVAGVLSTRVPGVLDVFVRRASTKHPDMRQLLRAILASCKKAGMRKADIAALSQALDASEPPATNTPNAQCRRKR